MTYSVGDGGDGSSGYTYAGVVIGLEGTPPGPACTREDVLAALRAVRFNGWLARPEGDWIVAVARPGGGTAAAGRRGVIGVGEWLAARLPGPIVAVRVVDDRQLLLAVWANGEEIGRYVSDPSHGEDDDTLPDPLGVEHAEAFATACGRDGAAEDLAELLAEELDPDSVIESERLAGVLRLLGLPNWLVASAALPRDVPAGPRAGELTRLGAGRDGITGAIGGWAVDLVRRRRPPPPAVPDAPRGGPDIEPWML